MFLKLCFQPLGAIFLPGGIRRFEEPVRVQREHVSWLCPNLGTYKITGGKNSQWHVWTLQLRYFAGSARKVQNRRMPSQPDPQSLSILGNKTKRDKHIR